MTLASKVLAAEKKSQSAVSEIAIFFNQWNSYSNESSQKQSTQQQELQERNKFFRPKMLSRQ
ncbi:hypothetical protein Tco_0985121, partial [Tanacetum coccineum]